MRRWTWVLGLGLCLVNAGADAHPQVVSGFVGLDPLDDHCTGTRSVNMVVRTIVMTVEEACDDPSDNLPPRVPGDIDLTFHFGFPPTAEHVAHAAEQLRVTSQTFCDMTDGRLRIRRVRMTEGAPFERTGDIWWQPSGSRAHGGLGLGGGNRIMLYGTDTGPFSGVASAVLAHELGHLVLNVGDSYSEQVRFGAGCGIGSGFDGTRGFSMPFLPPAGLGRDARDAPPFNSMGTAFVRGETNPFFNTAMQGIGQECVDAAGGDVPPRVDHRGGGLVGRVMFRRPPRWRQWGPFVQQSV